MPNLSQQLLTWYAKEGRELPWRVKGGAHPNPYIILVSEVMLQQTTVKTVIPYFHKFMARFPTIQDLAAAPIEDVYQLWQGLGYYSRARSLHASAKMIVENLSGHFPQTRNEILKLKGIGSYTAASFLALAFNLPETVVDGNVTRIICRMYHLTQPINELADIIREKAEALTDKHHPADYASAIMDLGATVCTPKNPQCLICPWQKSCLSQKFKDMENLPLRNKIAKQEKHGRVYLIYNSQKHIFIRQRKEKGLLSGLYEFPWTEDDTSLFSNAVNSGKSVTHVFTHIRLTLDVYIVHTDIVQENGLFIPPQSMVNYPFSTLMKKVYKTSLVS